MKLLFKSPKKLDFQLPQKIFNQCNRQRKKFQTRSWKAHLVALHILIACSGQYWDVEGSSYAPKAPALTGFFYCFNRLTNPINQPSIPGTIKRSNY